jgi:uncharacterized protein (TIGR02145 family)
MSFDGKGGWTEIAGKYNNGGAANADNSKFNHGRSSSGLGDSGRGICPEHWHVPTDFEWGIILDGLEGGGTAHQNASDTDYKGTYAGKYGKSTCTTTSSSGAGVDDTHAYWYYNTDDTKGTDKYGFRVLPAGRRNYSGSNFYRRGILAFFWSSSAYSDVRAWIRSFGYAEARVARSSARRSNGFSVRCIRDE